MFEVEHSTPKNQRTSAMTKLWVLILCKRGFTQEPEFYFDAETAEARKRVLLRDFNPDYDELEVFEKTMP
jgi:hypothetical protein